MAVSRGQKQIFDFAELVTLQGAAAKDGRRVQEKDLSVISQARMLVVGGEIVWLGRQKNFKASLLKPFGGAKAFRQHSFKDSCALPGFVECHSHLVFAGSRQQEFEERNRGVSYEQIAQKGGGILSTVRATRRASTQELLSLAQDRAQRFLRQGVTVLEVKSGYGLSRAAEIKMLEVAQKIRGPEIVPTFLGAHARPPEFSSADEYIQYLMDKVLPLIHKKGLARRIDIFWDKGYFHSPAAKSFLLQAQKMGFEICGHVDQLHSLGGVRELLELRSLSLDHVVQLSDPDLTRLARSSSTAVLLPGADFYLRMKYPPARRLIDEGARVALATDFNPGSCPTQDLSLIGVLARLEMKMTLPEVLTAYTYGGAAALGLQSRRGSLEPGKSADFVLLKGGWQDLFYSVGHHPVTEVWLAGRKKSFAF